MNQETKNQSMYNHNQPNEKKQTTNKPMYNHNQPKVDTRDIIKV